MHCRPPVCAVVCRAAGGPRLPWRSLYSCAPATHHRPSRPRMFPNPGGAPNKARPFGHRGSTKRRSLGSCSWHADPPRNASFNSPKRRSHWSRRESKPGPGGSNSARAPGVTGGKVRPPRAWSGSSLPEHARGVLWPRVGVSSIPLTGAGHWFTPERVNASTCGSRLDPGSARRTTRRDPEKHACLAA